MSHKIYGLFHARYRLYKDIYLNRKVQAIDLMIAEALKEANHVHRFDEVVNNPNEYIYLSDYVLNEIERNEVY